MYYLIGLLPYVPIFVIVTALIYLAIFMVLKKKREKSRLLIMFAEYMLIGWFVVFIYVTQIMNFGNGMGELFNIQPLSMFHTAFRYGSNNAGMVWQFLLNILMFVPLGFLLPIVFPKKCASWPRVLFFSFCASLLTELVQLITQRGTDIDDVIANTAGGLCGFALFVAIYFVTGLINCHEMNIPHIKRKVMIGTAVLLAVAMPFAALTVADRRSVYGNLYYGHLQPRTIQIDGNISKDATTRAVYKYTPHTDLMTLQEKLIAASGFNGEFSQHSSGRWELHGKENELIIISSYQTWSVNYPSRFDNILDHDVVLNEDEALSCAWSYLSLFGITPESVRYEASQSRFDNDDYRLVFSNIESKDNQIVVGDVIVSINVNGELMSVSDGRIWGEYVRDVDCISPFESIEIARDVGVGESYGTAYISSIDGEYEFIGETGYIIPVWKINARFKFESGIEIDWFPVVDAIKKN